MSFDMFVQAFRDGGARTMPTVAFLEVFGPHVESNDGKFWVLRTPDGGEADLYASTADETLDSLMLNHFSPGDVLDLVVEFARKADAVIMPIGCPTLLVDAHQSRHLPEELRDGVRVVTTGADVLAGFDM